MFKEEILSCYEDVDKGVANMVSALMPPRGKVVYVSDGEFKVPKVHDGNPDIQTIYYVTEKEVGIVRDRFMIKSTFQSNHEGDDMTSGNQGGGDTSSLVTLE